MSTGSAHNVVLVHGGFVDGSGWPGVHDALTADGYRVAIVQNPTLSLEDDAAATRRDKPSWYLVATDDPMIPPPAQRVASAGHGRQRPAEEAVQHDPAAR